jgi:hypothetical protein
MGYNWSGIDWANEQDVAISRRIVQRDRRGRRVLDDEGEPKYVTRERVRQMREEAYFKVMSRILKLRATSKVERTVHRIIRQALEFRWKALERKREQNNNSGFSRAKSRMLLAHRVKIPQGSKFFKRLATAYQVFHPIGWHSREGTIKKKIADLPITLMTAREISEKVGCGVSYVAQAIKELGVRCKKDKRGLTIYDWDAILPFQWKGPNELSNEEIAKKLGVKNPAVVAQYRWRKKKREEAEQLGRLGIKTGIHGRPMRRKRVAV